MVGLFKIKHFILVQFLNDPPKNILQHHAICSVGHFYLALRADG